MKVNDYRFWKSRIETAPANSRGAFDQFVQDQRPMAQEPRNMYNERIPFGKGLSVPKYPDLRQFGAYESPAKTKLINDTD